MLKLGLNDRSPLRLIAMDISLLLLSFRRDDQGRTYAAVGATEGDSQARDLRLYAGDVLELAGPRSGVHRLVVSFAPSSNCMVSLDEIDPKQAEGRRVAGRLGPVELARDVDEQHDDDPLAA